MLRSSLFSRLRNGPQAHAGAAASSFASNAHVASSTASVTDNTTCNDTQSPQGRQRPTEGKPKRSTAYAVPEERRIFLDGSAEKPVARMTTRSLAAKSAYQAWRKMMELCRKYFPEMVERR